MLFEDTNVKIYGCVNGDIGLCFALANITFLSSINLDIGVFKQQLLYDILITCMSLEIWMLVVNALINIVEETGVFEVNHLPCLKFLDTKIPRYLFWQKYNAEHLIVKVVRQL